MPVEHIAWNWEEAFDKFGFGDGDDLVMTYDVVAALNNWGYEVEYDGGIHNTYIHSIRDKNKKDLISDEVDIGYDNPRDYLPKRLVNKLDKEFPSEAPYCM